MTKPLTPAAERALAEAEARRAERESRPPSDRRKPTVRRVPSRRATATGSATGSRAIFEGSMSATTFVLVHGAWHGGWCYARVAALLRARGHTVFTPTLTGQGERAHLLNGAVNLSTHIEDVLGVFRCERLTDVVLAGHSYGGMVITGVADRIPERIKALAYLDAFIPETGNRCSTSTFRPIRSGFSTAPARSGGLERSGAVGGLFRRERRRCRDGRCARDAASARLLHREAETVRRVSRGEEASLCARHRAAAREPVPAVLRARAARRAGARTRSPAGTT